MMSTFLGAQALATPSDRSQLYIASDNTDNTIPYLLDDLGCNGSETNLLDCLPQHNCMAHIEENAGVKCLREGLCSI